jgi:transposase
MTAWWLAWPLDIAYVHSRLSNARVEGLNGKIRTITRRSFGFAGAPPPS